MPSQISKICAALAIITILSSCSGKPEIRAKESSPIPITPEARTARLTSYILVLKTKSLRNKAVYLKHREEGRRLLELENEKEDGKDLKE
jgi:hypothetical protein